MKNFFMIVVLLLTAGKVGAQELLDTFNIGPYEVDYRGQGDVNYRLKKGVDLYEYFGLKKDTIIQVKVDSVSPINKSWQVGFIYSVPRYSIVSAVNAWGIEVSHKNRIGKSCMFNAGLMFDMLFSTRNDTIAGSVKTNLFEIGVPLSFEFGKLDRKKASLFGGVGVIPTFYTTTKNSQEGGEKSSGFYIAPRVDFGGYIPVGKKVVRLDAFMKYNIKCAGSGINPFTEYFGRVFVGGEIGIIF